MRVVIDCNVVVSAARSGGVCGKVIVAAVRDHQIVLSDPILDEYLMIAGRRKHADYRDSLLAIIKEIEKVAIEVEPAETVFGIRDPDDEVYLATAVAGDAIVLITGNSRDFTEPNYGSVEVLSPRAFLDRIK